ncbi:lymphocyte antigen 86 [Puntigrus tetrazona]|uniref:lymphocyte antigen 86 n=1 Tax=Puntigrus tetrazona TaxID=1606681 RepID=UPI001C8AEA74|nr:lymphocyte antigen 86 [Puntigrus tetrazona]
MMTRLRGSVMMVLILVQMNGVRSQDPRDPRWPLHTICDSGKITVTYTSCDPLQDVGFTFLPCPERLTDLIKIRLALFLRQPVDELYSSYELWLNGHAILKRDEPLCLPHFPRFKFCGSRRGEIITIDSSFKSKIDLSLKANFDLKLRAVNQDGFLIACVNATLSFH